MPKKKTEETPVVETPIQETAAYQNMYHATLLMGMLGQSLKEQKTNMVKAQAEGKLKNNKFNEGYMTALDDMTSIIMDIVRGNVELMKEEEVATEHTEKEELIENAD